MAETRTKPTKRRRKRTQAATSDGQPMQLIQQLHGVRNVFQVEDWMEFLESRGYKIERRGGAICVWAPAPEPEPNQEDSNW